MTLGFFCVFRRDPQPYALAARLVASARRILPDVPIVQFTDPTSPPVPGVTSVARGPRLPMLESRLTHYATCEGDWLLVDTDVELRQDVSAVFPPHAFDLAVADRNWPGMPQGDEVMLSMPFNTGVVFSRNPAFWQTALATWQAYPADTRDWLSEQRAVYDTIRTGRFLVQILPGQVYNYPPRGPDDPCTGAAIVHHKGPLRKDWYLARSAAIDPAPALV